VKLKASLSASQLGSKLWTYICKGQILAQSGPDASQKDAFTLKVFLYSKGDFSGGVTLWPKVRVAFHLKTCHKS
jgi:hypothetical protein